MKKWIFKRALPLSWLVIVTVSASASTFVGNGGNAEDLELKSTLSLIEEGLRTAQTALPSRLCRCSDSAASCGSLDQLSATQVDFCARFVQTQAPLILNLLNQNKITWNWTSEPMKIKEGEEERHADAVADERTNTITINKERFSAMGLNQRQFLITHELLHLAEFEGKHVADHKPIGSFEGPAGGRELLNAAAESVTNLSYGTAKRNSTSYAMARSKASATHWFELDRMGSTNRLDSSLLEPDTSSGWGLRYRLQWQRLSASVHWKTLRGGGKGLSTISLEQEQRALGAGLSYRIGIGSDPLSFWGQSHLLIGAQAEVLEGQLKIADSMIGESSEARSVGYGGSLRWMIPMRDGAWFYIETASLSHNMNFEFFEGQTSIISASGRSQNSLGVSYAF